MTNRSRVLRALTLLFPVPGSLARRAPAGMSKAQADIAQQRTEKAVECLRDVARSYEAAEWKLINRVAGHA